MGRCITVEHSSVTISGTHAFGKIWLYLLHTSLSGHSTSYMSLVRTGGECYGDRVAARASVFISRHSSFFGFQEVIRPEVLVLLEENVIGIE